MVLILLGWYVIGLISISVLMLSFDDFDIYEVTFKDLALVSVFGLGGLVCLILLIIRGMELLSKSSFWNKKVFHKKLDKVTNFGKAKIKVG